MAIDLVEANNVDFSLTLNLLVVFWIINSF